jgi:hypothetical protein
MKKADGVAQVVGCLPSKYEAPSSNPNTEKKLNLTQGLQFACFSLSNCLAVNQFQIWRCGDVGTAFAEPPRRLTKPFHGIENIYALACSQLMCGNTCIGCMICVICLPWTWAEYTRYRK